MLDERCEWEPILEGWETEPSPQEPKEEILALEQEDETEGCWWEPKF